VSKRIYDHPILNQNRGQLVPENNNPHGSKLLFKQFTLSIELNFWVLSMNVNIKTGCTVSTVSRQWLKSLLVISVSYLSAYVVCICCLMCAWT